MLGEHRVPPYDDCSSTMTRREPPSQPREATVGLLPALAPDAENCAHHDPSSGRVSRRPARHAPTSRARRKEGPREKASAAPVASAAHSVWDIRDAPCHTSAGANASTGAASQPASGPARRAVRRAPSQTVSPCSRGFTSQGTPSRVPTASTAGHPLGNTRTVDHLRW